MPCRYYFWTLILILVNCATFSPRRSEFKKGLEFYQQANFLEATKLFRSYYVEHPSSDTTLYYLYDCYRRLNQPEQEIRILEQLVNINSKDENVYLKLFYYYRKTARYNNLYELLIHLAPPIKSILDEHYTLTRRLYAEIVTGAAERSKSSDPVVFTVSKGYLPTCPDGKFYGNDTITNGNLIILLDRLIDPVYPQKFLVLKNISDHSFLYLPYMRLIHLGIIEFDPELNPGECASITMAAKAVANLKNSGFFD